MLNWKLAFDLIVISKLQDDIKADGETTCGETTAGHQGELLHDSSRFERRTEACPTLR